MEKLFATIAGIVFLLLGILGFFIENLLGIIHFDMGHNVIHLVTGAFGLLASRELALSKLFAKVLGVVYIIVGVFGVFIPEMFGIMAVEITENILHLVVGAIALYLGYATADSSSPVTLKGTKKS